MNRFQIKLIACLTMLIDHVCLVFFPNAFVAGVMRQSVGRMAFPLFVFMLGQGFFYTRSRIRYCRNLLILAIVSEIPYDFLFNHTLFYWKDQNVIFTLLTALILFCLLERFNGKLPLQILFCAGFAAAAQFLRLDYGLFGIAAAVIVYYTNALEPYQSCAYSCIPLILGFGSIGTLLAALPLLIYKKTGGRFSAPAKLAFYIFYPGHIAVLLLIQHLL